MCIYICARPHSHPHLLVCNRRAQTGSSSTQTNNQCCQNIMRIRHNEAPRITDMPCALLLSSFTPRVLRYPNTSALATALYPTLKAIRSGSTTFSGGHSTFNPLQIHAFFFLSEHHTNVTARTLVTCPHLFSRQQVGKCAAKEVKDECAVNQCAHQTSFSSQQHIFSLISRE